MSAAAPQRSRDVARWELFAGGRWRAAEDDRTYESVDPFTGEAWAVVPNAGVRDVDEAVASAQAALAGEWGALGTQQRARLMLRLAELIARDADRLAELESRDNGKLLRETRAQVAALPDWLRFFAGVAETLQGTTPAPDRDDVFIFTRPEPVGVVAAIVPWNSPLQLLMWKLAPALAAGCPVIVKPSVHTPVSALALAQLVEEAGFPAGVLSVLPGQGRMVGQALAEHPGVDKVAFTGSTEVGIAVAKSALEHVARVTLELGGKSAQVVLPDADLDAVANGVIAGVFAASGQTCIAGSRLLVHEDVHDALVERIVARARTVRLGDPLDAATEMGPLGTRDQLETVLSLLEGARAEGVVVAAGGGQPAQGGLFVEPTVLTGVTPDMEISRTEVFGPVLAVTPVADEDEAVRLANDSPYALAAGVWTADVRAAHRLARRLKAGTVWVNTYRSVAPYAPFGGMKQSGIGRESGVKAVEQYLENKTVWVELSGQSRDPFVIGS